MSNNTSTTPNADRFAAPDSPGATFLSALQSPTPSKALTLQLIQQTQNHVLYHLLPLLMSTLQFVAEYTVDRESFLAVLSAFRSRLLQNRVLKQRFLLHAAHPSFNAFWRVVEHQVDGSAYLTSQDAEEGLKHDGQRSSREIKLTSYADDDLQAYVQHTEEQVDEDSETREATCAFITDPVKERAVGKKHIKQVQLHLSVDDVDQQTRNFWRSGVCVKDVEKGHQYAAHNICNPFSNDGLFGLPGSVGESVIAHKVFSSIARPKVVHVRTADGEAIEPGVLVKSGDNLMQDLGVMHIFQLLNCLWAHDETIAQRYDRAPLALWYDVIPIDLDTGLMQAVSGLQSLKDFDWKAWREQVEGNEDMISDTVRTTTGSYIATYILG